MHLLRVWRSSLFVWKAAAERKELCDLAGGVNKLRSIRPVGRDAEAGVADEDAIGEGEHYLGPVNTYGPPFHSELMALELLSLV